MDLRGLEIFVRIAEGRSFAAAARALGVTPPAVSNAVARLEGRLGVRLLARTTRRVSLTDDGAAFFERCRQALAALEEAERVLGRARLKPAGRLRLELPVAFGRLVVLPLLGDFASAYPEVTLAVTFSDRYVDLVEERVDAAVRFGTLPDTRLVARKLADAGIVVCGSPAYLARRGRPATPEDLTSHDCLTFVYPERGSAAEWRFRRDGGQPFVVEARGRMSFDSPEALADAARAGFGLAQVGRYLVERSLAVGELVSVLDRFAPPGNPVSVLYPHARHLSPKVRAFVDFLAGRFSPPPPWAR